ncbi:hypothetical protein PRK78_000094 [Emydomyces testavorans]|uniref:Uncharacterized protein n=1 Tax=Emydomyces testavorans TaxID=2070801 RepID=A0AAF0IF86_9EURO|nr:hypothetical protein PRK78_000094 [Emydomyces testavorans]
MAYTFSRSVSVITELARDAARTPPPADKPNEYIDQSLVILGRTFNIQKQWIQQEFLTQREFIDTKITESQKKTDARFGGIESRITVLEEIVDGGFDQVNKQFEQVNGRFEQVNGRFEQVNGQFEQVNARFEQVNGQFEQVNARFEQVNGQFEQVNARFEQVNGQFEQVNERFEQVNEQFERVDARFEQINDEIRAIRVELANSQAIYKNGRLHRLHQPINLIKMLKPVADSDKFVWVSHPQVPKHMKGLFYLGQQAKGEFPSDFPKEQKARAKRAALATIRDLANFYEVVVYSDDQSETDATETALLDLTVDAYMEDLLDVWGMDWQKVLKLGQQLRQPQGQQAGTKRAASTSEEE